MLDEWEDLGDPCVDDFTHTTFNTQGTNAFYINGTDKQIIMLERHNTKNFLECSYVWLIPKLEDGTVKIEYLKDWKNVLHKKREANASLFYSKIRFSNPLNIRF